MLSLQLGWDEPVVNLSCYSEAWHAILPHNQLEEVDQRSHSILPLSWVNAVNFAIGAHLCCSFQQLHETVSFMIFFENFSYD